MFASFQKITLITHYDIIRHNTEKIRKWILLYNYKVSLHQRMILFLYYDILIISLSFSLSYAKFLFFSSRHDDNDHDDDHKRLLTSSKLKNPTSSSSTESVANNS